MGWLSSIFVGGVRFLLLILKISRLVTGVRDLASYFGRAFGGMSLSSHARAARHSQYTYNLYCTCTVGYSSTASLAYL
jgi:hypothetical protein